MNELARSTETIRVLLIDDDEEDALLTGDLLRDVQQPRYAMDWVDSFDEGLARMEAHSHDIYLIDYRLGIAGQTGLDLLKRIAERQLEIPIILLTGLEDREIDIQAEAAGASDYLVKGQIDTVMLDRAIRYTLSRHRMLMRLRAHEKERDLFVAMLTHDLRTPLNAEHRIFELLKSEAFGPVSTEMAEVIEEVMASNRYMRHMVSNLLTAYQLQNQGGQVPLTREPTDLNALVEEVATGELAILSRDKRQSLKLSLSPGLPVIAVDPVELRRVFYNLVQNAITYTPAGGEIELITRQNSRQDAIEVQVCDTGQGMDEETLSRLFQPFQSQARKYRQIGTGLGLYLSRQIVEAHGGKLSVSSVVGQGSCFSLSLPMTVAQETADQQAIA